MSVAGQVKTQKGQTNNVPWFPPPPVPSISNKKSSSSRLKHATIPRDCTQKSWLSQPPRSKSLRHTVGSASLSRKRRLEEKHLADIKLSPRHWILIVLLLLSFLTLILGFIFADCVALPHTNGTDAHLGDDTLSYNGSLYRRQDSKESPPTALRTGSGSNTTQDVGGLDGVLSGDTNTDTNTTAPAEAEANESKRLGFDSPKNLAILFFYTATLPLLTMIHTALELMMLCYSKRHAGTNDWNDSNSDNDSLSNLKPLSLIQKQGPRSPPGARLSKLLALLPTLSLAASLLLIAGWITITSIQIHCEMPIPTLNSPAARPQSQQICPIQVRGHYMHGIHELSIVKSVFGWVLAVVYIAYAGLCLRAVSVVAKAKKTARRRETATRELEFEREMQLRKKGRESVVRFTVDEGRRSAGLARGKTGVNVGVVEV